MRHRLTNVDPDSRVADCSVCGPVAIKRKGVRKNGNQIWACETVYNKYTPSRVLDLSRAQVNAIKLGKSCAICGSTDGLVVDHDHVTLALRGVLCSNCNTAIGLMGDDTERLQGAIGYLTNPPGVDHQDTSKAS